MRLTDANKRGKSKGRQFIANSTEHKFEKDMINNEEEDTIEF